MNYEAKLQNVTVLGAAGKMGSGILLLTAIEMADLQLKPENRSKNFALNAIDVSPAALTGLYGYLKIQVRKLAEKKMVQLRLMYKDNKNLIENGEIIDQYIDDVLKLVHTSTSVESAYDSGLIFEAIIENSDLKVKLIKQILANNNNDPWFFTNTSSVPINELDTDAEINGKILGFHFYNPPAVQKLVELIVTEKTKKEVIEFAREYAKKLRKIIVPSNDKAGFIGNGHFMRDILFGIKQAESLMKEMSFAEAIYAVNTVSQDFMIRPMGIFQLMDYVGLDVCQKIMFVMKPRLNENDLQSDLIDKLNSLNVKGGQNSDGSQKAGILLYEKGRVVAVYDPEKKNYVKIDGFKDKADKMLGSLPTSHQPWKSVIGNRGKDKVLADYFNELKGMDTLGSKLTRDYVINSKNIGLKLVSDKVTDKEDHVNTVMLTGFFHAYGPINNYFS
ncbi:MAG: 3-hydroxyacyl-CoA dehydrogenase family protein [Bacteroidales bacterium]|nr:3-hydroxyacyl-CoA dehydrogenase family protein [Bacteroidales bacterium]